jgi:hypothetical protein
MTEKMVSKELHDEFQAALEDLEVAKQAMLNAPLGPSTTQARLAAFESLGAALDKAAARCSQVARKIAAL